MLAVATPVFAQPLSGTFTQTASTGTTSSGTYTTPEGETGAYVFERLSATGYNGNPNFTTGATGIMAQNVADTGASGGDAFSYRLTLTPTAGRTQSLIVEVGQAVYGTSFNTEPGRFVYTYGGASIGTSSATVAANPSVTMHPTNGTVIGGLTIPQLRTYTSSADPVVKNTTPAASHPPLAVGTAIISGSTIIQNYGVATTATQYRIDFDDSSTVTVAFTGNMLDGARTGETFNETISFGVRSNPAKVRFLKQSNGGTGTFSFSSQTNLSALPGAINTATANPGPATPTELRALSLGTSVTLTESAVAGFAMTGFSCSDSNSGVTGNTGTFGSFAGNVVTIPATNIKAGANLTCTVTNSVIDPELTVAKTSTLSSVSQAGTNIPYSILVSNSGNVTLTGITVTDPLAAVTCPTSGNNTIASLGAGLSETCTAQYQATQADFDGTTTAISNTATAQTTFSGTPVSANSTNNVTITRNRLLTVDKQTTTVGPLTVGQVVNYTYLVTNTGNVTVSNVNIDETAFNGAGTPPAPTTTGSTTLAPGQTVTFTASYTITQSDINQLQ
ncbi:MAG: DUF7507 domain-containing protein [Rhizobiaceae bacterium]